MKIMIDGYEVEIKARDTHLSKRANKTDTMNLLNAISVWVMEAADAPSNEEIEDIYRGISDEIYKQLEAEGCYKDI